jgi:iron complex outermembrane receptor protein
MIMLRKSLLTSTGRAALASLFVAGPLAAQQAAPAPVAAPVRDPVAQALAEAPPVFGSRADLLITTEKRPAPAATVPMTVTAFTARDLEGRNIYNLRELGPFVPNMFTASLAGNGTGNVTFIRGLGSAEPFGNADPAVATFVDEIYIGRLAINNIGLLDVGRIEVVSGSQGTLLGRNTSGGAIGVVMAPPAETFGGYGEFRFGSYNQYTVRASLDVPLGKAAGLKLSGFWQDNNGYVDNTTTGEELNDVDGLGIRGALRVDLAETVRWNVAVAYVQNSADNLLNFTCDQANPTVCDGRYATTGLSTGTSSYAPLVISGAKARYGLGNESQSALLTSNLEWSNDALRLNLITGFLQVNRQSALDYADGRALPDIADPQPVVRGYPLGGATVLTTAGYSQFSQEARLTGTALGDRLSWVAGLLYFQASDSNDVADLGTAWIGAPQPFLLADRTLVDDFSSLAGYVEGDFALSPLFALTAGVRYTSETRSLRVFDNRQSCGGTGTAACFTTAALPGYGGDPQPQLQNGIWAPRFALTYTPGDALLVYASAARGWRSGGWDTRGTAVAEILPYEPETAWTYELGIKSQWFDGRLSADVTAFYLDASQFQAPAMQERGVLPPAYVIQNVGSYRGYGVEARLAANPWRALSLFANIGLQSGDYALSDDAPALNGFGIASVAAQQRACLAQLALGQMPLSPNSAPPGSAPNNAPACAAGIVAADGSLAEPVRLPTFNMAAGAAYRFHIPYAGIYLTPSAMLFYRTDYETGTGNATLYTGGITSGPGGGGRSFPANPFSGDIISGSAGAGSVLMNAALTMQTDDGNWTLALECSNCFDQTNVESSLAGTSYYNTPRTFLLRLKRTL